MVGALGISRLLYLYIIRKFLNFSLHLKVVTSTWLNVKSTL